MHTGLYLDTARLGRMCLAAQMAEHDFAKLASQGGCSLYFDRFLKTGYRALPARLRRSLRHLNSWNGVSAFRKQLCQFVGLSDSCRVLVASRSTNLMNFAAQVLFDRCPCVLTTDMAWPPYLDILRQAAAHTNRKLVIVPLTRLVLEEAANQEAVVSRLLGAYNHYRCEGVFLSDVTYLGVRLPISKLIRSISQHAQPDCVVIDGAQALNHRPLNLSELPFNIYLAGAHKWLQGYHPLGVAFCSAEVRGRSPASDSEPSSVLNDPLLDFCEFVADGAPQHFCETVDVTPLLTTAAALAEMTRRSQSFPFLWESRIWNAQLVADALPSRSWTVKSICDSMKSQAILIQAHPRKVRAACPHRVRTAVQKAGVTLSTYPDGLLRLSLPRHYFSWQHLSFLVRALSRLG
jgi:hypothetical protein